MKPSEKQMDVLRRFTPGRWMRNRELAWGLDTAVVAARLNQLVRKGMVEKRRVPPGVMVYRITDAGWFARLGLNTEPLVRFHPSTPAAERIAVMEHLLLHPLPAEVGGTLLYTPSPRTDEP